MPTEQGTVKEIKNRKAVVRVEKSSACAHCGSRSECDILSGREMLIEVVNDLEAKEGDYVELSVPAGSLLKLSLMVYFLPVVALIVGAVVGNDAAKTFGLDSTLASIICGGLSMVITFFALRMFGKGDKAKNKYYPRMTRIIFNGASLSQSDDNI